MTFFEKLREARSRHGMTADELARRIGLTGHAYRRWERGEVEPKVTQAMAVAAELEITLDELCFGQDDTGSVIEVRVQPGDSVIVRGDVEQSDAEPYRSPVTISNRRKNVSKVECVDK